MKLSFIDPSCFQRAATVVQKELMVRHSSSRSKTSSLKKKYQLILGYLFLLFMLVLIGGSRDITSKVQHVHWKSVLTGWSWTVNSLGEIFTGCQICPSVHSWHQQMHPWHIQIKSYIASTSPAKLAPSSGKSTPRFKT